jgi:hypothetical protein
MQSDLTSPLAVLDLTITSLFVVDVWMNFHTAILGE